MAYDKYTWKDGDVITSAGLNQIEGGIESAAKTADDAAAQAQAAQETAEQAAQQVTTNAEAIATNAQNIATAQQAAEQAAQQAAVNTEGLAGVQSSIGTMNETIAAQGTDIAGLKTADTQMQTSIDENAASIDALQQADQQTAETIEGIQTSVSANASAISGLQSSLESNTEVDTQQSESIQANTEAAAAAQEAAEQAAQAASANAEAIATNTANITAAQEAAAAAQQTADANAQNITQAQSDIEALEAAKTTNDETDAQQTEDINTLTTRVTSLESQMGTVQTTITEGDAAVSAQVEILTQKLNAAQVLIDSLREETAEDTQVSSSAATINEPTKRIKLSNDGTNAQITSVTAKAIWTDGLTVDSGRTILRGTESVDLSGLVSSGDLAKATANAAWSIETDGTVTITDSTLAQTGYNGIEIGLSNSGASAITIKGVSFTATLSNNAISIFETQDNAHIVIEDCTFTNVSNVLRLSNKSGAKNVVVDFINCTFMQWTTGAWAGAICLQDYTSANQEAVLSNALFGPDKLTINFTNCTGPDGALTMPEDKAALFSGDSQLAYVYNDKGGTLQTPSYSEHPELFPTINIQ